jgi:hypothetical protein
MKAVIFLVLVALIVCLFPAHVDAQNESCYAVMYTTAKKNDTWSKIAKHFSMDVSTLKAMNRGVRLVEGAMIKVIVYIGCPRPAGAERPGS